MHAELLHLSAYLPDASTHSIAYCLIVMHASLVSLPQKQVTCVGIGRCDHNHNNEASNDSCAGEGRGNRQYRTASMQRQ